MSCYIVIVHIKVISMRIQPCFSALFRCSASSGIVVVRVSTKRKLPGVLFMTIGDIWWCSRHFEARMISYLSTTQIFHENQIQKMGGRALRQLYGLTVTKLFKLVSKVVDAIEDFSNSKQFECTGTLFCCLCKAWHSIQNVSSVIEAREDDDTLLYSDTGFIGAHRRVDNGPKRNGWSIRGIVLILMRCAFNLVSSVRTAILFPSYSLTLRTAASYGEDKIINKNIMIRSRGYSEDARHVISLATVTSWLHFCWSLRRIQIGGTVSNFVFTFIVTEYGGSWSSYTPGMLSWFHLKLLMKNCCFRNNASRLLIFGMFVTCTLNIWMTGEYGLS